jgi:hypothetical protein
MKTILQLEKEIEGIKFELNKIQETQRESIIKREVKRAENGLILRRFCIKYLERGPSLEFILSERTRLAKIIESITLKSLCYKTKQGKSQFLKEQEFKKFSNQLKTLEFILEK